MSDCDLVAIAVVLTIEGHLGCVQSNEPFQPPPTARRFGEQQRSCCGPRL